MNLLLSLGKIFFGLRTDFCNSEVLFIIKFKFIYIIYKIMKLNHPNLYNKLF